MVLDLSLPAILRASSGALLALLGLALVLLPPRDRRVQALGASLLAMAPNWIISNTIATRAGYDPFTLLFCFDYVLAAACLAYVVVVWAPSRAHAASWIFGSIAAGFLGRLVVVSIAPPTGLGPAETLATEALTLLGGPALALFAATAATMAWRARASHDARVASGLAAAAFGIVMWPLLRAITSSNLIVSDPRWWPTLLSEALVTAPFFAAMLFWARARSGPSPAFATSFALGLPALAAVLLITAALTLTTGIDIGLFGIARLIAFGCLVAATFRYDAFGVGIQGKAAGRASLAGMLLVIVLIVAQVAQNFFAAQYGLLMGGVVAGAFLFAASPLQRAMESMRERPQREVEASTQHPRSLAREDTYRKALRIALHDRVVTRDEELHLFQLAEDLGIGAGRAMQLRHDVLAEKEAR